MKSRPKIERRLSKTLYCYGLQCTKQLWWRVHEPDAQELEADPVLRAVLNRGLRVGELARKRFPGGVLVEGDRRAVHEKVEKTQRAMAEGAPAVFEASFLEDGVFVAVDVLERRSRSWGLVEVKSTLDVKEQHIPDVAVQLHVLRAAGLQVRRVEVMHLNRRCTFPDLSDLFTRDGVTKQADALLPTVPKEIRRLQSALAGELPEVEPGPHCTSPYSCPFMDRCSPEPPGNHVSKLYRIGKRAAKLLADGIVTVDDLPDDLALPPIAARQARSVRSGRLVVEPELGDALAAIDAPIAFLDFETIMPAVPAWEGCHPYEQIPVQMSCHLRDARGGLRHREFLAEGQNDPRAAIAEAVVEACADARAVVVYNASFEKQRLRHLAEAVPAHRKALRDIVRRLVDLLPIVRDHVYHPEFDGSFSLKTVTPALLPGFSYENLEIGEGASAQAVLELLLLNGESIDAVERSSLHRQLRDYCERDTLAMVKLYERLKEMVA